MQKRKLDLPPPLWWRTDDVEVFKIQARFREDAARLISKTKHKLPSYAAFADEIQSLHDRYSNDMTLFCHLEDDENYIEDRGSNRKRTVYDIVGKMENMIKERIIAVTEKDEEPALTYEEIYQVAESKGYRPPGGRYCLHWYSMS